MACQLPEGATPRALSPWRTWRNDTEGYDTAGYLGPVPEPHQYTATISEYRNRSPGGSARGSGLAVETQGSKRPAEEMAATR